MQNVPCGARREAACGTAGAAGAARCLLPAATAAAGPGRHQQGSTAEVVGWQLQGAIAQAVWRGGSLGETVRGSGCREDSGRQRGTAAGSGGTSELGQWDSQGG